MIHRSRFPVLAAAALLAACAVPALAGALEDDGRSLEASPDATVVTADKLTFDYTQKFALFDGNVLVNDPRMQLSAQRLTIIFTEHGGAQTVKAEGKVLVDFYGDGCVPCAALMPHVHAFAETYGEKIKFCALNTTKARRLAISQKILGLPVIAIYENGEMIDSCVKEDATPENVEAMIKKYA